MKPSTTTALLRCLAISLPLLAASGATANVDDGQGKEWRQLTETTGLSWNQVAQVCPQDGASPCNGIAGNHDLTGWVWASAPQAIRLFAIFEPSVLPSGGAGGQLVFFSASNFLSSFQPTFSFAITYSAGASASGWTASLDGAGSPLVGSVGWSTTPVSISGGFGIGPVSDPNSVDFDRGIFLWRPTGADTGLLIANDDAGSVASPAGGVAIADVLANDWVAGARASLGNASLTAQPAGSLELDLTTGAVNVTPGAAPGEHTLTYQACALADPANCDDATVTVEVHPYLIDAVNDQGSASPSANRTAIASVLANDTLGGVRASVASVALSLVSSSNPGVTLDPSDGSVDVARGTALGAHTLAYAICERANPQNCDSAIATINVAPYAVIAGDDSARATSKVAAVAIASVFANDSIGGVRASSANVRLSLVTAPTNAIKLNLTTGAVSVGAKSSSGLYSFAYKICELADLANCDAATVTLDLSGRSR